MRTPPTRHRPVLRLALAVASAAILLGAAAAPAEASPVAAVALSGHALAAAADAQPGDTQKTVTKKVKIPFKTVTKESSSLAKGKHKNTVKGKAGVRTKVIQYTLRDGERVAQEVLESTVTKKPVTKVVLVGTKVASASKCDPNYSGECLPITSDVDCAGGSGNGPGYAYGPVTVIGSDIYDLDRDGDGIGCD